VTTKKKKNFCELLRADLKHGIHKIGSFFGKSTQTLSLPFMHTTGYKPSSPPSTCSVSRRARTFNTNTNPTIVNLAHHLRQSIVTTAVRTEPTPTNIVTNPQHHSRTSNRRRQAPQPTAKHLH